MSTNYGRDRKCERHQCCLYQRLSEVGVAVKIRSESEVDEKTPCSLTAGWYGDGRCGGESKGVYHVVVVVRGRTEDS